MKTFIGFSYPIKNFDISFCYLLTPSTPAVPNCCCLKSPALYWSNPLFLIFDIRPLWRSVLSARVAECQKLKIVDFLIVASTGNLSLSPLNVRRSLVQEFYLINYESNHILLSH